MSNLVYNIKGRAGDPASQEVQTDKNEWMSAEEIQEAYTPKTKTQVKLDPLQVCLYPTYLSLPEDVLQDDLRKNLQDLVSDQFVQEYGDDFVYFAFTDAKIDWHSGEDGRCGGSAQDSEVFPSSQAREAANQADPCTCALYSGATVMFHQTGGRTSDAFVSSENLEPKISQVLTSQLVEGLRNQERPQTKENATPFYTELKGTLVSWSAAERQSGGKLIYLEVPSSGQQLLEPSEDSSTTVILDQDIEDSTVLDVVSINALEGSDGQQDSGASAFSTTRGKILASVVGAILLVVVVVLFCVLRRRKQSRKAEGVKDTSTVISHDEAVPRDEVDEEIARGGISRKRGDSVSSEHSQDDQSEAAQYKSSNNSSRLLDSISVGSEWTLTTGVTSALGASSNKTMAEMLAAKETFDRDRQITLQKDMLQSEWSGAVVSPSGLALSRVQSNPYKPSKSKSKPRKTTIASGDATGGGLQFEEATGEGEEIFLMQPAR